jgi:hypothetical protein
MKRLVSVALAAGVLLGMAPVAHAEDEFIYQCVPLTGVETPGTTVLGQEIPALSDIEVCAGGTVYYDLNLPKLTMHPGCGNPCFTVKAYLEPAWASTTGFIVLVRYQADGSETYPGPSNPIVNPLYLPPTPPGNGGDPQEICLISVGDQNRPPCPLPV